MPLDAEIECSCPRPCSRPAQANEIIGLDPGQVFVQRNVGNLATHKDMNVMSCLEYAVKSLKVKRRG